MKIAFVGSHCVGKTTAVWHVGSALKQMGYESVEILPELARLCPHPINEEASFQTNLWIIFEQIKTEYSMSQKTSHGKEIIILSDRSVYDCYAYAASVRPEKATFMWKIVKAWEELEPYDLIIYFPIEWEPIEDGTRSTDKRWQNEIERLLLDVIEDEVVADKVRFVEGKNHTERCRNALKIVEEFLK